MPLNEARFINKANPTLAEAHQATSRPTKHEVLAAAGMVPGATGMGADLMSAALYAKEGDWKNTLWSLASFIPIVGMAAGAKRLRSIQKLKNHRHTIQTLKRHKLTEEGAKKLNNAEKELYDYLEGPHKKGRQSKVMRQGGNQNSKVVQDADDAKELSISSQLDDIVSGETDQVKIIYEKKVGLNEPKFTVKLTDEEKKLIKTIREEKKLYRELGGLQRGTRRSGKID